MFPTEPTPEEALEDLRDVHPELYRAYEHGNFKADEHFESEGVAWDGHAHSMIVRLHAKDYLRRKPIEATEIEHISLCGLWLRLGKYHVKAWKLKEDELRNVSTPASRSFQQYPLVIDGAQVPSMQLRFYWHRDQKKNLKAWLAFPKYDDPRELECYWLIAVPDPTDIIKSQPEPDPGDVPVEPVKTDANELQG